MTTLLRSVFLALLAVMFALMSSCGSTCSSPPTIDSSMVSVHIVHQGTMPMHTVGRGTIVRDGDNAKANVQVLLSFAQYLKAGNQASLNIVGMPGVLTGAVTQIGDNKKTRKLESAATVPVDLSFANPLPPEVSAGGGVEALIEYGKIENTLYMERGLFDTANAEVSVFRLDPDNKTATRVTVHFGVIASEMIEIKSGLRAGDHVIVTDMSRYENADRVRID